MRSYIRFVKNNRLYILFEAISISIAFAFILPLVSFWEDKWTIDHSNNYKHIYAICPIGDFETTIGLGQELYETLPEVEHVAQIYACPEKHAIFDGASLQISALAVNPGFYELFNIGLKEGISNKSNIRSALISTSLASKLGENPIGSSFVYDGEEFTITGIYDDFHNSLIPPTDVLFRSDSPILNAHWEMPEGYWDNIYTLIEVPKGIKKKDIFESCKKICGDYYSEYYTQHPENYEDFKIVRYDHISSNINNRSLSQTWGISLWAVELFGLILLAFACLNYVNLSIALSLKRGKEWALKKLLGDSNLEVILSSFIETFGLTLICFLIGYVLSRYLIPIYNNFFLVTYTSIELNTAITLRKALLYLIVVAIFSFIVSIIPASTSIRYTPLDIVNGKYRRIVKSSISTLLIGIQCFLTVTLLSVSTLFFAQYKKMVNRQLGNLSSNVYVISGNYTNESLTLAANALRSLPFVSYVGKSNDCPGDGTYSRVTVNSPDGTSLDLYLLKCDIEAFKAFGFQTEINSEITEGLWLSNGAIEELTLHSTNTDYGMIKGHSIPNIKGIMSDYVMNLESNVYSGVEINEKADFNRLIINVIDRDYDYSDIILKTFEEAIVETQLRYSPPTDSGYLEHFFQESIKPTKSILSMLLIYTILSLILGILGLIAISINYVSLHQKDSAIRKVYGASTGREIMRNLAIYLKTTLIASILGIMLSMVINQSIIRSYTYRLSSTFWIYILVAVFIIMVTFFSVIIQVSKNVSSNPLLHLRSE